MQNIDFDDSDITDSYNDPSEAGDVTNPHPREPLSPGSTVSRISFNTESETSFSRLKPQGQKLGKKSPTSRKVSRLDQLWQFLEEDEKEEASSVASPKSNSTRTTTPTLTHSVTQTMTMTQPVIQTPADARATLHSSSFSDSPSPKVSRSSRTSSLLTDLIPLNTPKESQISPRFSNQTPDTQSPHNPKSGQQPSIVIHQESLESQARELLASSANSTCLQPGPLHPLSRSLSEQYHTFSNPGFRPLSHSLPPASRFISLGDAQHYEQNSHEGYFNPPPGPRDPAIFGDTIEQTAELILDEFDSIIKRGSTGPRIPSRLRNIPSPPPEMYDSQYNSIQSSQVSDLPVYYYKQDIAQPEPRHASYGYEDHQQDYARLNTAHHVEPPFSPGTNTDTLQSAPSQHQSYNSLHSHQFQRSRPSNGQSGSISQEQGDMSDGETAALMRDMDAIKQRNYGRRLRSTSSQPPLSRNEYRSDPYVIHGIHQASECIQQLKVQVDSMAEDVRSLSADRLPSANKSPELNGVSSLQMPEPTANVVDKCSKCARNAAIVTIGKHLMSIHPELDELETTSPANTGELRRSKGETPVDDTETMSSISMAIRFVRTVDALVNASKSSEGDSLLMRRDEDVFKRSNLKELLGRIENLLVS